VIPLEEVIALSAQWTSLDEEGVGWTTNLHRSDIPLASVQQRLRAAGEGQYLKDLRFTALRLAGLQQEISGILVSWHRLDWMKSLASRGQLSEDAFAMYAASDIDLFHVRMRSAFDYLSTLVWGSARKRGSLGGNRSFRKLIEWLEKNESRRDVVGPLFDVVLDASDWFRGLRDIRDITVHAGGFSLVFPTEDAIGFMTLQPGSGTQVPKSVVPDEVMWNRNVVDFRKYACVHLCWLLHLVETVTQELLERWRTRFDAESRASGGGVEMLRAWTASFQRAFPTGRD